MSVRPPQVSITIEPSNTTLYEGIPVSLNCTATIDTSVVDTVVNVMSLIWVGSNGEQVTSSSSGRITVTDMYTSVPYTSVLTFNPVDDIDRSDYQCVISVVQNSGQPLILPATSNNTFNLTILSECHLHMTCTIGSICSFCLLSLLSHP